MGLYRCGTHGGKRVDWVFIYLWVNSTSDTSAGTRYLRIYYGDAKIFDKAPGTNMGSSYTVTAGDKHSIKVTFSGSGSAGNATIKVVATNTVTGASSTFLNGTSVTSKVLSGYLLP